MRIVPNSTINLYGNVAIDDEEQLVFSTYANQTAYFASKLVRANTPCTVVRKTGRLRVEVPGSVVSTCNYLSFINPSFDNKVVYARIMDYDYINNECVEIVYSIDYWQTWMFDVTFEDCYIEREHLSENDFQKSVTNPYDPTILEFKTAEPLPVSKDIEKPVYTYGNSNTYDGVFAAEAVCNDNDITNNLGLLLVFSDIGLAALDGYPTTTPSATSPSFFLWQALSNLLYVNQQPTDSLNFYKLSTNVFNYLSTHNSAVDITSQRAYGSKWNSQALGTLIPGNSNKINAPVNYVYVETVAITSNFYKEFNKLLQWFTDNSCLDNILGIYPVPNGLMMFSGSNYYKPIQVQMPTAATQNVENKKLDLFPYSYYRIIAPNGDIKELRIEDFQDAQTGQPYCDIALNMDITERPNLLVIPRNYKVTGANPSASVVNANISEALIYSQFPTMPYSISAWDIQLATVSQSIIANNTLDYSYDIQQEALNGIKEGVGIGGKIVNAGLNLAGGIGQGDVSSLKNGVSGLADIFTSGPQMDINQGRRELERNMSEDAYKTQRGNKSNAVADNLKYTKPAYGSNQYHQINGDGITNFNIYSFIDVVILKVGLNPTILARYDQYFKNYGYNSGRCGIPRVVNFARGETNEDLVPHWTTINGKPTTYIKTLDCRVIYSMLPVANFIKSMFDSGVRFINGDGSSNG